MPPGTQPRRLRQRRSQRNEGRYDSYERNIERVRTHRAHPSDDRSYVPASGANWFSVGSAQQNHGSLSRGRSSMQPGSSSWSSR